MLVRLFLAAALVASASGCGHSSTDGSAPGSEAVPAASPKPADENPPREEQTLISLVLLRNAPAHSNESSLADAVVKAWPNELVKEPPRLVDETAGKGAGFRTALSDQDFLIIRYSEPYWKDREKRAATAKSPSAAAIVRQHSAWVAVDLVGQAEGEKRALAYRRIGRLIAELADGACIGIYCPETNQLNAWTPKLSEKLRSETPLAVFDEIVVPFVSIADDDAEILAAMDEARRRWTEFTYLFENRLPSEHFSVKTGISDGAHTEAVWVTVRAVSEDVISGVLDNRPRHVTGMQPGDVVRVRVDDIQDWLVAEDRRIKAGGFTIKVIEKRMGGGGV